MDELKLLIEMVANLPTLAVWVLVGYLAYKIIVVGSIYGLARFAIEKLHNWLTRDKTRQVKLLLDDVAWGMGKDEFLNQLRRVVGEKDGFGYYITESRAEWLGRAIDEKLAKDMAADKK